MRADSWILYDLPEILVQDWYELRIETEFDLQVAAYYWLRKLYDRERADRWIVRSQPQLAMPRKSLVKPDLVIFNNHAPYDVIELKCQLKGFRPTALDADIAKLKRLKKQWNVRHAYLLVLYDSEDLWEFASRDKESWMRRYLTFIYANVRLHSSGRRRKGYDRARELWDRHLGL